MSVPATVVSSRNTTVDGLMRRYDHVRGDPAHQRWGDKLVAWRKALVGTKLALRGAGEPNTSTQARAQWDRERSQWKLERDRFRASCVGNPSDHGLCAVPTNHTATNTRAV
jgi:hypothetical protein